MDTHEISMHYRARPVHCAEMPFGQWFCEAIHMYDPRLRGEESIDRCKSLILSAKYNEMSDLREKLTAHNIKLCQEIL